jgi:DNA invertase Pin-like site-specific DNA recombinase
MSKKCPQKAIIFARVSTQKQVQEGHSLSAQVSRLQEYCKQKNLEAIKEFSIAESLTTRDKRPFNEMINFIKQQKEPIALVVDAVDRLQRSFKELPVIDELIQKENIEIHFYKENFVLNKNSSGTNMLRWDMSVLFANSYVSALSDNVKRGIQSKLQKGEWIGKAPFGYKNITLENGKKDIAIDEVKSLIVKEIFDLYSIGKSLSDISEKLGLSKNIVDRIVSSTFYSGEMQVNGKYYKHKYPTIIEKEVFDKCQKVRKNRKNA